MPNLNRIQIALLTAALGCLLVAGHPAGANPGGSVAGSAAKDGKKPAKKAKVEGTVAAISASGITISNKKGSVSLTFDTSTKLERNDKTATVADILVGDHAEAVYDGTTLVASKVEVEDDDD